MGIYWTHSGFAIDGLAEFIFVVYSRPALKGGSRVVLSGFLLACVQVRCVVFPFVFIYSGFLLACVQTSPASALASVSPPGRRALTEEQLLILPLSGQT